MSEAAAASRFAHPNSFFIGGKWVPAGGKASFDVIDSFTEEPYLRVPLAEEHEMARAVSAARDAFDNGPWSRFSHAERAEFIRAIAREIRPRAPELAKAWVTETGVVSTFAEASSKGQAGIYESYADFAATYPFEEQRQPALGNVGLIVREPVGVVAAIIAWNAPLGQIAHKCMPALLAGCTVILKCAPESPSAGFIFAEACDAAGLPPGVVNVVVAGREVSEQLVRNPGVDKVSFTGSSAVGRQIAAICGDRMARYTLELGGKSAGIVFDDYDIPTAARTITGWAIALTGQACSSLTRILVTKSRHDALVDAIAAEFAAVKVGNPHDPATQMGPLAMQRQRDRVERYIAQGVAEGGMLAAGGQRPAGLERGYFIEPTVFGRVDNHATIAREEIFGPVLSVIPLDSESDAVRVANDSPYGLNASVFTDDVERAYAAARELRSGTVGHNSFRTDFKIAFGGFKQSGVGREGGIEGLQHYLETKTIILDQLPSHLSHA